MESKNLLVVVPSLPSHLKDTLSNMQEFSESQIEHRPEFILESIDPSTIIAPNITLIELENTDNNYEPFATTSQHKIYKGFYTADCSMALNCIPNIERTYIIRKTVTRNRAGYRRGVRFSNANTPLPDFVEKNLDWKIQKGDVYVLKMKNDQELWQKAIDNEDTFDMGNGVVFHLYK